VGEPPVQTRRVSCEPHDDVYAVWQMMMTRKLQTCAVGLSKARRAGVDLPPPKRGKAKARTRRSAGYAYSAGQGKRTTRRRPRVGRAATRALKREPTSTASRRALSRHATRAASRRSTQQRSEATRKAARTKGAGGRSAAARKAARTRARNRSARAARPARGPHHPVRPGQSFARPAGIPQVADGEGVAQGLPHPAPIGYVDRRGRAQ